MSGFNFQEGEVILVDKPLHWTSFDVVNKVRHALKQRFKVKNFKVGHAGTLDPLATGLLVLCTGKKTKVIEQFQAEDKEYTGIIMLGATTPSSDLETEVITGFPTEHISADLIVETAKLFLGDIQQIPPLFSAKKVDGKRAYELARKGRKDVLAAVSVRISEFEITKVEMPEVHFRVRCSKGTYIRSIARDFGEALQSGAYLAALCRTRSGSFKIEDALTVDQITEIIQHTAVLE
jgi:tRNA pseudouridine55 synthase